MEFGERGGAYRFVMWTGRSVTPYGVFVYLVSLLIPAAEFMVVSFLIGCVVWGTSSTVPKIVAVSLGGAVVLLGAYVGLFLRWTGEAHFEAKNGRLVVRHGTRRIRGRAVTFSLATPVALYGEGPPKFQQLSLRQDRRRVRLGQVGNVFPHEYVRWNSWLREVGGSVDVQWQLPPQLHIDVDPIALDVATNGALAPLPDSHRAPLEIAVPQTRDANETGSDTHANEEEGTPTETWLTLHVASRRPKPIILVGEPLVELPVVRFENPSDRFWLRRGRYVVELRFGSPMSEVVTLNYKGQGILLFAPASREGDTVLPVGDADGQPRDAPDSMSSTRREVGRLRVRPRWRVVGLLG